MYLRSYIIPQTIDSQQSRYNGKIEVIVSFGKLYLNAGGLMQSGPFLERVWSSALNKLKIPVEKMSQVLILGYGGGSFSRVLHRRNPGVRVVGVDIDPIIVKLGQKYLAHTVVSDTIVIEDAQKYIKSMGKNKKYDLIFIDVFTGYDQPQFAANRNFLEEAYSHLRSGGFVVCNRLNFGKYKAQSEKIAQDITSAFSTVQVVTTYSNMLISIHANGSKS